MGKTVETVERVFSECDVLGDGQLSYSEAVVCWSLLETDEFVLLSLLRGVSAVPDLYGACGNMFASQFATSQPFLQGQLNLLDNRSWTFRARLAIALIEMAASLETTPYGTLYLCDVKGQNFGLVRQPSNNWLTAKTIDLDLSYFKSSSYRFAMHRQKECNSDNDCTYVDCHISCIKGTCSGAIISNNLQVSFSHDVVVPQAQSFWTGAVCQPTVTWLVAGVPPPHPSSQCGGRTEDCLGPVQPLHLPPPATYQYHHHEQTSPLVAIITSQLLPMNG